jgi:3-dehydroquinate synthase
LKQDYDYVYLRKGASMTSITIHTTHPYSVIAQPGSLSTLGATCAGLLPSGKICVVTDSTVDALYAPIVTNSLGQAGFTVEKIVFPPGEPTKSMASVETLLDFLAKKQFTRSDSVLALGGGVIGDLSGFCASIYLRGLQVIQVPTTLLAAVDSSVGGKTGVNLNAGKNLAGTFWQPSLVVFDPMTMATLPHHALLDGLAETIKCGMLGDKKLFEYMACYPWTGSLERQDGFDFIQRCVADAIGVKQKLVEADVADQGQRQLLNFGHTIGHAIELASQYTISHGHAVAKGMVIVTRAAAAKGWTQEDCLTPLLQTLNKYGFPLDVPYSANLLAQIALQDKKRKGSVLNLVVPLQIGECRLRPILVEELAEFVEMGLMP